MLQIKDLCCGYGNMTVLRDINFELGEGGTLALVGSNGAGKTTLLMSIAGHIIPVSYTHLTLPTIYSV